MPPGRKRPKDIPVRRAPPGVKPGMYKERTKKGPQRKDDPYRTDDPEYLRALGKTGLRPPKKKREE